MKGAENWREYRKKHPGIRGKRNKPDWEFVGVDGESTTDADGFSHYQILAASVRGKTYSIEDKEQLSTVQCLEFLLNLPRRRQRVCVCGFAFNYDVNHLLVDLRDNWRKVKRLSKGDYVGIYIDNRHRYVIKNIPKKALEIWKKEKRGRQWVNTNYVRVYDVFGFFQCSFLKAIEEHKIGNPEQKAVIEEFKARRGEDLRLDWDGWKRYNAIECDLLILLMDDFYRLLKSEDIHLSNWWGAGAIAAFWYKQHDIKSHLVKEFGREIDDDIKRAFFGGHIQRLKVGVFPCPVYHYDICSAYPWGQKDLPSLKGTWRETDHYEPGEKWALYEVEWDFRSVWDNEQSYGPLPVRTKHGTNVYPVWSAGTIGVFWEPEVTAVLKHWPQCITILKGRIFTPETDHKPFEWIGPLFLRRNLLKMQGDPRNIPLKLGLNSLYGKTVQAIGKNPPYQSYMWGGLTTSKTRAKVIEAIALDPSAAIAAATDGLFTTRPLPLETGTSLGDWQEEPIIHNFELYANGVYRGTEEGGKKILKARGMQDKEFNFDALRELFLATKPEDMQWMCFKHKIKRFNGYQLACHRNKPELFCRWTEEDRQFYITGLDCFRPLPTDLPNVYRIQCTMGFNAGKLAPPRKRKARIYERLSDELLELEDKLAELEQPGDSENSLIPWTGTNLSLGQMKG